MLLQKVTTQEISVSDAVVPGIEATAQQIISDDANAPATAQTVPVVFKIGSDQYSFVGVFTKVS